MKELPETCLRSNRLGHSLLVAACLMASVLPGVLQAQSWSGGSELGIQIRGSRGPVTGAIVKIRRELPGFSDGPEHRRTDSRGQANFVGIAPGLWNLEISHPEYLTFVSTVSVQRGKKPGILTQFLEASGTGRGTFRVKFLRSSQALGEAISGTSAEPPANDRPVSVPANGLDRSRVETKEEATVEETAEPVTTQAVPARVVEPPAPPTEPEDGADATEARETRPPLAAETPSPMDPPSAPAPAEDPASNTAKPQEPVRATPPQPSPRSMPKQMPDGEPAQASPPEVAPAPPSSELPPPETPTPTPEPRQPEQPALEAPAAPPPASLRGHGENGCAECKPGEWAATAQLDVPGGAPCRSTAEVAVRRALRDVAAVASEQLGGFSGPLPLDLGEPPLSNASLAARNTLAPYLEASSSCRFLAVVLPAGAQFTGFRFDASDETTDGSCTGQNECEVGKARFLFSPSLARGAGAAIVYSVFENTGDTSRRARMTGFFLPATGWNPE